MIVSDNRMIGQRMDRSQVVLVDVPLRAVPAVDVRVGVCFGVSVGVRIVNSVKYKYISWGY